MKIVRFRLFVTLQRFIFMSCILSCIIFPMRHGFSLVELSIVLVILGLLTGGILAGQSLIRAAELRSVSSEAQRYTAAVRTFQDKYMALPGDMTNATSFWGAAHATPATCLTTAGTGTQTCNGDGDGDLDPAAAASQRGELFTFWEHLANAGLIEGDYTGFAGPGSTSDFDAGTNSPLSRLGKAGWAISDSTQSGYGLVGERYTNITGGDAYVHLVIGGDAVGVPSGFIMKPEEAWGIDTKLDDGKPGIGAVKAFPGATCGNNLDASVSAYTLTSTTDSCWLTIRI